MGSRNRFKHRDAKRKAAKEAAIRKKNEAIKLNHRAVENYYNDLKNGVDREAWAKANAEALKLFPEKKQKYIAWVKDQNNISTMGEEGSGVLPVGPLRGEGPSQETLRWPRDIDVGVETDYVYFQFGKYIPPFGASKFDAAAQGLGPMSQEISKSTRKQVGQNQAYELSSFMTPLGPGIILPMPQDLGNEIEQNWSGKSFTQTGRAAISALAGDSNFAVNKLKNTTSNINSIQAALKTAALNVLPGAGGNLTMNDITGSTAGIVLNPNAELLYDSPTLREIGMTWKLIANNQREAEEIKSIVDEFRMNSLPQRGSKENNKGFSFSKKSTTYGGQGNKKRRRNTKNDELNRSETFITVPNLCKFSFMSGSDVNNNIAQFKPCAINRITVNYTPDGTYATYSDGRPVAIELGLSFLETKVIFRDDVSKGY